MKTMKKILVSACILFSINGFSQTTRIYCKPELKYCIYNLKQMKRWLIYDYKDNKIPEHIYQEYLLVLENTRRSLEMMVENKGQCDTTAKPQKFTYDLQP